MAFEARLVDIGRQSAGLSGWGLRQYRAIHGDQEEKEKVKDLKMFLGNKEYDTLTKDEQEQFGKERLEKERLDPEPVFPFLLYRVCRHPDFGTCMNCGVPPDEQALARSEHQKDYAAYLFAKEQWRQRRMDPPLKARQEKEKEKEKKKAVELNVSVKEEEMETVGGKKLELIVSVKEEENNKKEKEKTKRKLELIVQIKEDEEEEEEPNPRSEAAAAASASTWAKTLKQQRWPNPFVEPMFFPAKVKPFALDQAFSTLTPEKKATPKAQAEASAAARGAEPAAGGEPL